MLKGVLGKKLGIMRFFGPGGQALPVTVIEAGPCYVMQKKTKAKEGYEALQLGFEALEERKLTKPMAGHFQAAGQGGFRHLKEFKVDSADEYEVGQSIDATIFEIGEKIHVTAKSKGRGFAGTIKRHNFSRGPETHGSHSHREPGSVGTSATPARVLKGRKMPGQMGDKKVTVKNLTVVDIRPEQNIILVKGAVPGAKGGIVVLNKSDY